MKKNLLLFMFLVFTATSFSQSYYYTYTAGKTKFTTIIRYNKSPKTGEKKWAVTIFDVYNRARTVTENTDDPLTIYPFLGSIIIMLDKAKMNSVLFNDPNREVVLQELFNKFSKDLKDKKINGEPVKTEEDVKEVVKPVGNEAEKPAGVTDSGKVKKDVRDTFNIYIGYADTSIFRLSVIKEKDLTILELCKVPKEGDGDCSSEKILDANEESFNDRVVTMIQKIIGKDTVDTVKIKPVNVYGKYKKDEAAKQVKEKPMEIKSIEDRLATLENEKVTFTDVGIVSLRDNTGKIKIHKPNGSVFETEIDSVDLVIREGQLMRKQLLVKTGDGYFWNHGAPIPVNRINERGGDTLRPKNAPYNNYILLSEILEYIGDGYIPDDTTIALTPAKSKKKLSATSNLNSLINFAIYTDLTGLLGRRANAIINTDVSGRFITNTRNIPHKDITPLAFIEANFVLSKFDSKFKSLDSSSIKSGSGGAKDTVDRMLMMQTAWFKGSVKLNLLSWRFFYYQAAYLNIGARINVVNGDSLFKKERDILFFDYFLEGVYSISKLRNFGLDLTFRQSFQKVADKEPFSNNGWQFIFNPQVSFSYFPIENRNSKIYLRFNYFANRKKDASNFYQLELGIKSDLKFGSKK